MRGKSSTNWKNRLVLDLVIDKAETNRTRRLKQFKDKDMNNKNVTIFSSPVPDNGSTLRTDHKHFTTFTTIPQRMDLRTCQESEDTRNRSSSNLVISGENIQLGGVLDKSMLNIPSISGNGVCSSLGRFRTTSDFVGGTRKNTNRVVEIEHDVKHSYVSVSRNLGANSLRTSLNELVSSKLTPIAEARSTSRQCSTDDSSIDSHSLGVLEPSSLCNRRVSVQNIIVPSPPKAGTTTKLGVSRKGFKRSVKMPAQRRNESPQEVSLAEKRLSQNKVTFHKDLECDSMLKNRSSGRPGNDITNSEEDDDPNESINLQSSEKQGINAFNFNRQLRVKPRSDDDSKTVRTRKLGKAEDRMSYDSMDFTNKGPCVRIPHQVYLPKSLRRRYSTGANLLPTQHEDIEYENPEGLFMDNARNSNTSARAVYSHSRTSVGNSTSVTFKIGDDFGPDDGQEDSTLALLNRKPSLGFKIRAWRTSGMEEAGEEEPRPRMRHTASLPSLMSVFRHHRKVPVSQSSLLKSNQRQHFQQLQPQNYNIHPPGSQRRLRRRCSVAQIETVGTFMLSKNSRKQGDSEVLSGLRKRLRKTMSQGDFNKLAKVKNFMPLVKFRRAVKMVLLMLRATDSNRERNQRRERQLNMWASVLDNSFTSSKRAYDKYGISFDPQDFKANREIQVSPEAKAILSLEPNQRSPHQLRQVLMSLRQAVKEFSEFPITMQESLARVGWYERFEAKRVIIRQGHNAENFYFILSGTTVVIVLDTDKQTGEQTARTAAFLGKGKSFGELALMHKAKRSATVTCRGEVELLAVGREDFIDIFMHVEKDVEPEHVRFLRTLPIIRDWPIEVLPLDNPQVLLFTYVRRGVLLCRDSNTCDWIYIIKSGSCSVIKALRGANTLSEKKWTYSPRNHSIKANSSSHSQPFHSTLASFPVLPGIANGQRQQQHKTGRRKKPNETESTAISLRNKEMAERAEMEHMQTLDAIMEERHSLVLDEDIDESATDSTNSSYKHKESKQTGNNTVFVQILKLAPRDIFGLESCVFKSMNTTTSTSLVSGGAELIMINRKFFLDHTSEQLRKRIRREIRPLPSEETLQDKLENMISWEAFRHLTLKEIIDSQKKQAGLDVHG